VGRRLPQLLAILSVLAALVATGCGGDRSNLIPSQRAQELTTQLDALKAQIDAGKCDGLATRIDTFHDDATSLTKPVDSRLRKRINEGVTSLRKNALTTCRNIAARLAAEQADQTQTDTTTTDTTTTETTTTETTPTTSTPTTSTPTDTSPPTTVTPPDTGGGTGAPSDTTPGDTGSGSGDGSDGSGGGTGDNGGVSP
jgi:Tfp pilus assembly major pilin PilA